MAVKAKAQKFDRINKASVRGRVKHTRTGACTCKRTEKCFHGRTPRGERP